MSENFGILTGLVDDVGALMAAGLAISLAFKGRNSWEPSEEDIPNGPARIAGSLTAVAVGYLWFQSEKLFEEGLFSSILFIAMPCVVISFLIYIVLITVFTFDKVTAVSDKDCKTEKIIGGLWLSGPARDGLREKNATVQHLLEGAAYDSDLIWPRFSRALSKVFFVSAYLALIVSGSVMLTAGAILLNNIEPAS